MTAKIDFKCYAEALFSISEEMGKSDDVLSDLETVVSVLERNVAYVSMLDTPAIPKGEKLLLLDQAFSNIDSELLNLLKILSEHRAIYSLGKIKKEYEALYDESRGVLRVEAVSAVPLTEEEIFKISEKLSSRANKVVVKNTVSAEILGGLKLRYDGIQVDGTLKTRLDKLEETLKNIII